MKLSSILVLAFELTLADLKVKQFQRLFGPIWWMIEPFMMSLVFYILTRQLSGGDVGQSLTFILISLTLWKLFQRSLESSLTLFLTYSYVIKQINLPLMAPVLALIFTEFIYFSCGFVFMLLFGFLSGDIVLSAAIFYVPFIILAVLLVTFAFVTFFSSASVYVRDLPSPVGILLSVAFFLSPGIYTVDSSNRLFQVLSHLNPFFVFFPAMRGALLEGRVLYVPQLLTIVFIFLVFSLLSYIFYRSLRPSFLRVF